MRGVAIAVAVLILASASLVDADDRGRAPVIVSMQSRERIRVQVSEGTTMPCDSQNDRMLFDSTLGPGEAFNTSIATDCICVRHTSDAFPQAGWSTSGLACRRRICSSPRHCRPDPDPTIRVTVDASR